MPCLLERLLTYWSHPFLSDADAFHSQPESVLPLRFCVLSPLIAGQYGESGRIEQFSDQEFALVQDEDRYKEVSLVSLGSVFV